MRNREWTESWSRQVYRSMLRSVNAFWWRYQPMMKWSPSHNTVVNVMTSRRFVCELIASLHLDAIPGCMMWSHIRVADHFNPKSNDAEQQMACRIWEYFICWCVQLTSLFQKLKLMEIGEKWISEMSHPNVPWALSAEFQWVHGRKQVNNDELCCLHVPNSIILFHCWGTSFQTLCRASDEFMANLAQRTDATWEVGIALHPLYW